MIGRASLWIVVAGGLAACSSDSDPFEPGPNTVVVSSNQFTPAQLSVSTGTAVMWTWQGGEHDLTFEDGTGNVAARTSGSANRTFATAGTYRYRCQLHSSSFTEGMVGSIVAQ